MTAPTPYNFVCRRHPLEHWVEQKCDSHKDCSERYRAIV